MLRCCQNLKTPHEQGLHASRCRGEDSNLCRIAERFLRVGDPLQTERLYVVQEGDTGPVKIGLSNAPVTRLRILQVGNPRPLYLLAWLDVSKGTERKLHAWLAPYVVSGEWYEPHDDVLSLISACQERALQAALVS